MGVEGKKINRLALLSSRPVRPVLFKAYSVFCENGKRWAKRDGDSVQITLLISGELCRCGETHTSPCVG